MLGIIGGACNFGNVAVRMTCFWHLPLNNRVEVKLADTCCTVMPAAIVFKTLCAGAS